MYSKMSNSFDSDRSIMEYHKNALCYEMDHYIVTKVVLLKVQYKSQKIYLSDTIAFFEVDLEGYLAIDTTPVTFLSFHLIDLSG